MTETSLLDLPDELLTRCLAGAGGIGIASAAATCTRLDCLARRLRKLPVFSSAMSTAPSLQHAIRDAAHRALTGCYGAVDFALLFVANYGNARGKKYSDPTDLGHAVDMLRDVLGQDAVIVGCACAGLMGVGHDSVPLEVDPLANLSRGRAAAAARKKAGLTALPTKGVSVLLGKLPAGCVARGFVQETMEGPPPPADPDSPPAAWSWPFLDESLALTSSQKAALAQQLHTLAPSAQAAHPGVASSGHLGDHDASTNPVSTPSSSVQPAQAAAELGASPETAAAAEGLLSVVAAATAAANAGPSIASGAADDVKLVPQLCLLLYDNALQSFGYTENPEMERALAYLAAQGIPVLGGASSGAGDLFYSPGADGRRIVGEPPATAQIVGLMLCTATAPTAAAPADPAQASSTAAAPAGSDDVTDGVKHVHSSAAATEAAAAGSKHNQDQLTASAPGAKSQLVDSHAALHTAGFAALGLGPSEQGPLFTHLHGTIASSQALSVNHIALQLEVDSCCMITPAAPAQQVPASQQEHAGTASAALDASAVSAAEASAATDTPAASEAASGAADGNTAGHVRRSARLAATSADSKAAPVALTPLHHLYAAVTAAAPVAAFDEDDDEDQGQYLALWLCDQSDTPAPFTGDEGQVAICELLACELETKPNPGPALGSTSSVDYVEITAAVHVSSYAVLRELINKPAPGSSLCCQVVGTKAAACARTVSRCLSQMLPMIHHSSAPTASTAAGSAGQAGAVSSAGAGRAMQDCYDALARGAVASGARSGLQGIAVCSCTGRGQSLYAERDDAAAFGQVSEAQIIDSVGQAVVPFVGVYVSGELGPEVHHMCSGWCKPEGSGGVSVAEMQGFTSMFAGWGCQPGVA